jgi:hypothetical protein
MITLDNPITFAEVNRAINKLKKGKSPGLNGIPPEALKAMDNVSRRMIHRHVCDFFDGTIDHEGWHRSQCIPVPKRGDLSDPNKWRGIMLMAMCSKVFLLVMTRRAFTLLDKHGTRFQFGGTPEIGCRDGLFTLKAFLNARHNHDLASYVGFVDLVKAYDTANHTLLIDILWKYGAPPKFVKTIETIYRNKACVLKIENEIAEIPQTVGVRQGDNMAPVLFLFLMTAFAETLEIVWKAMDIPVLSVLTAADEHIAEGRICSHTPAMFCSAKLTVYSIIQCLNVDDGAFPFGTRDDLQRGMNLTYSHFARFGLEMHIGRGTSESKTECVFFPPPQFFQRLDHQHAAARTIQRAFHHTRRIHVSLDTHDDPPVPLHALAPSLLPEHFTIGSRVAVVPHHPRHGNKHGTVTNHTAKFVTFSPDASLNSQSRILPKSVLSLPPPRTSRPTHPARGARHGPVALPAAHNVEPHNYRKQQNRDNDAYDKLPKTATIPVADGYVSFTRTFRYLGSLINFSLRDDDDITAQIAAARAAMGALKEVWRNPHLDVDNKYLLFRAIPMNLLLWGAETWSL